MNLFENLIMFNESNKRAEEIVDYNVLRDYGIEFYERGDGELVVTTNDFDPITINIEETDEKWFVNLPSEDINAVDTDLTSAIIKAVTQIDDEPLQVTPGRKAKLKKESSNNTLWNKFANHYNGFIPIQDMTNYFSLDQFGEFIQWCRKEVDLDYDYEKRYSDWSEIYQEINDIWDSEDVESISVETVFDYFTTDDLNEFWNWVVRKYDLDEDELEESKEVIHEKVKERDFLGTEAAIKKFKDLVGDTISIRDICECLDSEELFAIYKHLIDKYGFYGDGRDGEEPDLHAVNDVMYEESDNIEEATSGIGAGAYTTKAIDILPAGIKKVKESLYDEYLERVMDEKSNVELVNILHEIRDNTELKPEDKKKLEDEIRIKVRTIKTEAITEFYGKEWTDEEIQKLIDVTKDNPDIVGNIDPSEYADPFNYNGKTYYTIGEGKEITFDGKECSVFLTVDEELKRYLSYFEITYSDEGDGENGPDLQEIISDVPYKVVEV